MSSAGSLWRCHISVLVGEPLGLPRSPGSHSHWCLDLRMPSYGTNIMGLFNSLPILYMDPGTGSAIMSAVIGFFVVAGLTIKGYWYRLKSVFSRGKSRQSD